MDACTCVHMAPGGAGAARFHSFTYRCLIIERGQYIISAVSLCEVYRACVAMQY